MSGLLGLEVRNAARGLWRAPTVAISAVLCLALGIGATVAISSAIDRALFRPLPFVSPERLVTIYRTTPQFNTGPFSAPNYVDLARESRRVSAMAAVSPATGLLTVGDEATQVSIMRASGSLFPLLGARAQLGRLLTASDDAPGSAQTVVISDDLWSERFGRDPTLVGATISLDGEPRTVVGILPRDFAVPHGSQLLRAQVWRPMRFSDGELGQRRSNYLMLLGRLAPGATPAAAQTELVQLFDGIAEAHPELRGESLRVLPLQAEGVRTVRTPLLLVFGAVCIVLLIAATNVASLLLARAVQRQREIAIRAALGGSRWDIVRPVLVESHLVVAVGLLLGLGLAWIGVRTIGLAAARFVPQLAGMTMNLRVVAFAVVLSAVVALVCGAAPAWRGTTTDPQDALRAGRGGGAGRSHHRALGALVTAEVALSLVLLLAAGLVLKGFATLLRNDPGFETGHVLTLEATVSAARYPDATAVSRFLEPALRAIEQAPGVDHAAAITLVPYTYWGNNFNIRYEGQPGTDPTQLPLVENRVVTPGFFAVTGQRLLSGRLLRQDDDERDESPAVVVVNQALARRDFGGRDPVGKRFHTGDTTFATIVGMVSDIRNSGPVDAPRPEVYWTYRQGGLGRARFPLMIRVRGADPTMVVPAVRRAIASVDPSAAVTGVRPMREVIGRSVGWPRFYLTLLGVFAAVATLLAVAGIYGVMSYAVAQRTRELGIRSALGSTAADTLRLVARQGMTLVGLGLLVGLAGAAAVTRLLVGLLFGVSPLDAGTWTAAALTLAAAGLVATLVPALRATRVDPAIAMRVE